MVVEWVESTVSNGESRLRSAQEAKRDVVESARVLGAAMTI